MEEQSFWDTYPDAGVIEVFRDLRLKFGVKKGSDMMWLMYCAIDPVNTFMQHLPPKERMEELKKYYNVTATDLKSTQFKKAVEWFKKYWISPTRRMLNALREKIFESQIYIENYPIKTAEDIGLMGDIQKTFESFKKSHEEAESAFKIEGPTKKKTGGGEIGPADDGSIFDLL